MRLEIAPILQCPVGHPIGSEVGAMEVPSPEFVVTTHSYEAESIENSPCRGAGLGDNGGKLGAPAYQGKVHGRC
jgi:hypothetical protein